MNGLRFLTAYAITEDSVITPECGFMQRTSEGDLVESMYEFEKWYKDEIKAFPSDKEDKAFSAIWKMVDARTQFFAEMGFREGVLFGKELYGPVLTENEITLRARARNG